MRRLFNRLPSVYLDPLRDNNVDWSYSERGLKTSWKDLPVKTKPRGTPQEFAEARKRVEAVCNKLIGISRIQEADGGEDIRPTYGTPQYIQWLARRSGKPTNEIARELAAE